MRLDEMRTQVADKVGFQTSTPDQDFTGGSDAPWSRIDRAINEAGRDELTDCAFEAGHDQLQHAINVTWPASQLLLTLPSHLVQRDLIAIWDTTNDTRGEPLWMSDRLTQGEVVWRDYKTMEWGTGGPGQDTTLLITFNAVWTDLQEKSQEPICIPRDFHHLIPWCAAIILRDEKDENVPDRWLIRANSIRARFWKKMSQTQPLLTGPRPADGYQSDWY